MAQPSLLSLPRRGLTSCRRLNLTSPSRTIASYSRFTPTRSQHLHQQQRQRLPPRIQRPYYSEHHSSKPLQENEYSNSQLTILSAALAHVPRHGFSRDALTLGARDSGFLDVSVQLLPRGEFDLVLFWLASRRGLLRDVAEKLKGREGLSVEEKVRCLVMERLRMNEGVKGEWQGALALMSLAGNIPLSLSELHALSSDILNLAGDTSVDSSWYTKRVSVAAIYASAEVYMTRDQSPGLVETEEFANRRFEDSVAIGEKLGGVKECLGFMGSTAVGLGKRWGLKI